MYADYLRQNWGLVVAGVLFVLVATIVLVASYRRSARGQLGATVRVLREARKQQLRAAKAVTSLEERMKRLLAHETSVKPRVLSGTREALQDARMLAKIEKDRVLVAANHVRKVIHEEYPPARQAALRQKYLPGDKPDARPFTF